MGQGGRARDRTSLASLTGYIQKTKQTNERETEKNEITF